jgi:hypothetical protein
MPADPVRQYSFTDWQVSNPTAPPPGDRLDAEFDRADNAIADTIDWASTSLNTDGSIRDGIIGQNQLQPDLFSDISGDIIADVQPLVDEAAAFAAASAPSSTTAATAADTATNQATAAGGAAANAAVSAMTAAAAASAALDSENTATAAATDALNADNHATGEAALCTDYGVVTQAWAEHMPDPIPPNILAVMGVTGNHWSSRWWAHQAALAFGAMASLYLGAFHGPPTSTPTGDPIPVGAIYYDLDVPGMFVWNGTQWVPMVGPGKSLTISLAYLATAGQTTLVLTNPDLNGKNYALNSADPEPIEIYANGTRLWGGTSGDYTLVVATSTVTFLAPLLAGTLIIVDVLAPLSQLTPGRITTVGLLDFDINPTTGLPGQIDGTRVTFPLAKASDHSPVSVAAATELQVVLAGVIQQPGTDYNTSTTTITFGEPPTPGDRAWALWFSPGGS